LRIVDCHRGIARRRLSLNKSRKLPALPWFINANTVRGAELPQRRILGYDAVCARIIMGSIQGMPACARNQVANPELRKWPLIRRSMSGCARKVSTPLEGKALSRDIA
jgi:hypothetical protein